MRRKSNVNFYVLPKISPGPSVYETEKVAVRRKGEYGSSWLWKRRHHCQHQLYMKRKPTATNTKDKRMYGAFIGIITDLVYFFQSI